MVLGQFTGTHQCCSPARLLKTPQRTRGSCHAARDSWCLPVTAVFSEILLLQDWVTSSGGRAATKGSSSRVQGFCSLGYHGGSTVKSARLAGGEPTQADPPGSAHCLLELHHHYHHHYPTPPHHHHHHHPLPHPTTPGSLCPRGTYPQSSWILATLG